MHTLPFSKYALFSMAFLLVALDLFTRLASRGALGGLDQVLVPSVLSFVSPDMRLSPAAAHSRQAMAAFGFLAFGAILWFASQQYGRGEAHVPWMVGLGLAAGANLGEFLLLGRITSYLQLHWQKGQSGGIGNLSDLMLLACVAGLAIGFWRKKRARGRLYPPAG